ncbi:hypothetical protein NLU13_9724 [Sarocladium strictum]|uniref:cyclin-dependent kinase n=1 Tax=Sarocladium strictum TaxID=5046 RepID=A0AA39GAM6_SARSR|nr:hypothetical protein NLU13_9724 [Sarocladium strictum]
MCTILAARLCERHHPTISPTTDTDSEPHVSAHACYSQRLKPRRRRRHAAMKDPGGHDDGSSRARSGGSLRASDRPSDAARGSRPTRDTGSRHRHSHHRSSSHSRHHSRERSTDRRRHSPSESPRRRPAPIDDLIPRYRASKEREVRDDVRSSRLSGRERRNSPSGSVGKRPRSRSRSPSQERSHRKKSRRDRSSSRRRREPDDEHDPRKRRRRSPHDSYKSSSRSHSRRSRSPERVDKALSRRRSRSRSGTRADQDLTKSNRDPDRRHQKSNKRYHRSRTSSPTSISANKSPSSARPKSRERLGKSPSNTPGPEPRDRGYEERSAAPTKSPFRRERYHDDPDEHYSQHRPDITDDMGPRRGYRGDYAHPYQPRAYPDDGYPRSPQHPSHYRDSGGEPYPSGRDWEHSPPTYAPQDRGYGPPRGPSSNYPPEPQGVPQGPQYPPGGYRGRGNGFRGSFSGRGGRSDAANGTPRSGANAVGLPERDRDHRDSVRAQDDSAPESELPASESRSMAPPNRPPPTGPASHNNNSSSKFSFAFKASSKPVAAAPKPEISQKFNAAPKGGPSAGAQDREPPRSAPTEPASARARNEGRVPDGPRIAPRMRKVKKMIKRPKPRPTLAPDLAASESVFYRKPGNESVVGSGTYGKVFKGLNVYTKGLVALKRIRMEGERDGFPVTAVREIKLLQSLRHTNIVNLQEVMVEKNDCFMVFEYLSHDLTGLLNHPTFKLEPAQKKHLAKQMFEGLDYLHTRGVLHRDIKAANILVSKDGILKLADFGLARFYAKHHQLDYTNRVITIWYRSPELLLGETQYTAAVDVWSAACVMVEIFARNAIFPGDGTELNQLEKIYSILGTPNRRDWPGLVDMAWFELLRPSVKRRSVFAEKYAEKVTPAAFDLLEAMFLYDPAKRPTAAQVLQHAYFTVEEPFPKQAVELATIDGEWHEFESKALRKENERKAREARRAEAAAVAGGGASAASAKDKDRKRSHESRESNPHRDAKRAHLDRGEPGAAAAAIAIPGNSKNEVEAA